LGVQRHVPALYPRKLDSLTLILEVAWVTGSDWVTGPDWRVRKVSAAMGFDPRTTQNKSLPLPPLGYSVCEEESC
jgi:hypothetical protein